MNKKPVVIGGIIFLFVIAMIVVIGNLTNSGQKTQQAVNSENHSFGQIVPSGSNGVTQGNHISPHPSTTVSGVQQTGATSVQWIAYNGEGFSFQYPSNWSVQASNQQNSVSLKLSPINSGYYDPVAPSLQITRFSNSDLPLKEREGTMLTTQSTLTHQKMGNQNVDVISITAAGPVVYGQSYGKVTTEYIFAQKGNDQYYIIATFSAEASRDQDKVKIDSILNSLFS